MDDNRGTESNEEAPPAPDEAAQPRRPSRREDPSPELLALMDLAVKYPPIAVPLAQLAFKVGCSDIGERIVRMGLDGPSPGIEYFFVAANAARRERNFLQVRELVAEAVHRFGERADEGGDDAKRLLHLVRLGLATLVFDEKDPFADPEFVQTLARELPALESFYPNDAFFHTLLAQSLWFSDRTESEKEWERAIELDDSELAWNARGTWYKDAERKLDDAEDAYRAGLELFPNSHLLLHNLAQVLVARAAEPETQQNRLRKLANEADGLLRRALRGDSPKGLRRHIHETMDELDRVWNEKRRAHEAASAERSNEPKAENAKRPARTQPAESSPLPKVGDVFRGKVASIPRYGAFVTLPQGGTGLLHKTQMIADNINDPANFVTIGEELEVTVIEIVAGDGHRPRVSLSQRGGNPPAEG